MIDKQDRRASLLKEQAAKFIQQEANTDPLITVTNATVSPDLKKVTIFVTTIPEDRESDALIFLKRYSGEFRHHLKKHCSLKTIPHVEFEIDYGERHRQNIDEIARNIKNEEN